MTDTNSNRPSHRLFNVMGDGDTARWTDIGVAWTTRHALHHYAFIG